MKLNTKKILATALVVAFAFIQVIPNRAFASELPDANPNITYGDGWVNINGNTYNFHQNTQQIIALFQKFNIGLDKIVNVLQPNSQAAALFRIIGEDPSRILGQLNANGHLFLLNPNGILFGQNSSVNVGALTASTLNITDQAFLNHTQLGNDLIFSGDNGSFIDHKGSTVADTHITFLSNAVSNSGNLSSTSVNLASGSKMTMAVDALGLVNITVDESVTNQATDLDGNPIRDAVSNTGDIKANGGAVKLSGKAVEGAFDSIINHSGLIEAQSVGLVNGVVVLDGGGQGLVLNNGKIDVSGADVGEKGGTAHVLGDQVVLYGNAIIDASGDLGGGEILVGGDYQGLGSVRNASHTYIGQDVLLNSDAIWQGSGGKVIVWANQNTYHYGMISARGGLSSGNGGFVEISGLENLDFNFDIHGMLADLRAPNGENGTLLLDPLITTIRGGTGDGNDGNAGSPNNAILNPGGLINFGTGGNNFSIYESEIEGQSAFSDITILSRRTVSTTGTFTDNDVKLAADSNLIIRTRNNASDGAGSIDLTSGGTNPTLEFKTQGTGTIEITGSTSGVNASNISLGKLSSDTGSITVSTSMGNIDVDNSIVSTSGPISFTASSGSIAMNALSGNASSGGAIDLTALDDIELSTITSTSTVAITSNDGAIVDATATDASANVTGTTVTLNGKDGIGTHLTDEDIDIDADTLNAHVTGQGNIHIEDVDDVDLNNVDTFNGSINIVAGGAVTATDVESTLDKNDNDISIQGTSISLVSVKAGAQGDVTLDATAGSITDGPTTSVTADDLTATATASVGSTGFDFLNTNVNNIEGSSGTGVFRVNNDGALSVGGVEGGTSTGVSSAGGEILLAASSPLTINETVTHTGTGRITLIANGDTSSDNITVNANVTHSGTPSTDVAVDIIAGNDIRVQDNVIISSDSGDIDLFAGANAGAGALHDLDGNSAGSIELADGSSISTTSGDLNLSARKDVKLSNLETSSGTASILAEDGTIFDNTLDETNANIDASTLTLTADNDIGSAGNGDINLDVDTLTAESTAGGLIALNEEDDLVITSIINADGSTDVRAAGELTATSIISSTNHDDNDIYIEADAVKLGSLNAKGKGDVIIKANGGKITDNNGGSRNVRADDLTLIASGKVGSDSNAIETKVNNIVGSAGGDFNIENTGELTIGGVDNSVISGITADDDIQIIALSPLNVDEAVVSQEGGDIVLISDYTGAAGSATTDTVTINANVTSNQGGASSAGDVTIIAGQDIVINNTMVQADNDGNVTLSAGDDHATTATYKDGSSTGRVVMNGPSALTSIKTDEGDIAIHASGDFLQGLLDADADRVDPKGNVIYDVDGDVIDNNGIDPNLIAGGLAGSTAGSFGSASNLIQLEVSNFEFEAGGIYVENTGALTIGGVDPSLSGLDAHGGGIKIVANSPITVIEDVTDDAGGDITLLALGSTSADTFTLSSDAGTAANVRATGGDGEITIISGGTFTIESDSEITTEGAGDVTLAAGKNYTLGAPGTPGDADADFVMATGTAVSSEDGDIIISARRDAKLTTIDANSDSDATIGNAYISTEFGSIIDNNAASRNILANELSLSAGNAVGASGDLLETEVSEMAAKTGTGGFYLSNTGDLIVDEVNGLIGIEATESDIEIESQNKIEIKEDVSTTKGGNISITTNSAIDGHIEMDGNVEISTESGNILINSRKNAVVAELNADSDDADGKGNITVVAGGAITDSNGGTANFKGDELVLRSITGVGTSADALESKVSSVAGDGGSGDFFLSNQGALEIKELTDLTSTTVTGVKADGVVDVSTASPLVIASNVTSNLGEDITLTAGGGGDISVLSGVQISSITVGGAPDITLNAGGSVSMASGSGITTSTGDIDVIASSDNVTLENGASISALVSGNIDVDAGNDVLLNATSSISSGSGAIDVDADRDITLGNSSSISSLGSGNVSTEAGRNITLEDSAMIESGSGTNTVNAGNDLELKAGAMITSTSGNIDVDAGNDIIMDPAAGTGIKSTSGNIDVLADNNIDLALVDAGTGNVVIKSVNGTIRDINGSGLNIGGDKLQMESLFGLGSDGAAPGDFSDFIDTSVNNIEADGQFGGVYILNSGGLTIGGVTSDLTGVTARESIKVYAQSPLTVDENVTSTDGGDISLAALGATNGDDLTLNADVLATGGNGSILLAAGDFVRLNGAVKASAAGTGSMIVAAGDDFTDEVVDMDGEVDADILMDSDSAFRTEDGNITLRATDDVRISEVCANCAIDGSIDDSDNLGDVLIIAGGEIKERNGTDLNITADKLEIQSVDGVAGTNDAGTNQGFLETKVNSLVVSNTGSGSSSGIFIENDGALIIGNGITGTVEGITDAGSEGTGIAANSPLTVNEAVQNTGGGDIGLAALGDTANDNITLNADVHATGGNGTIAIFAGNHLYINNDVDVSSVGTGDILLYAGEDISDLTIDQDGTAGGSIIMDTSSSVELETGTATLDAANNIEVAQIETDAAGTVILHARAGHIADVNAGDVNVSGNGSLAMQAASGVATNANRLETAVSKMEAHGGSAGGVFVDNTGSLTLEDFESSIGSTGQSVSAAGDNIIITAASPITVSDDIVNTGGHNISLHANGSAAADDMIINDNITASGGNGNITLTAGDDVIMGAGVSVTAESSGNVHVAAGEDYSDLDFDLDGNNDADITMTSTSTISTQDGNLLIQANDDISLGLLSANSNATVDDANESLGNVTVLALGKSGTNLTISDNNGSSTNIIGDKLDIRGAAGIGQAEIGLGGQIDTQVDKLEANGGSGAVGIINDGALIIGEVADDLSGVTSSSALSNILIYADSPITVNEEVTQTGGGNIILAARGAADSDDLAINANVTASGGNGDILLIAGDDVSLSDGLNGDDVVFVSAEGTGNIAIHSGEDFTDEIINQDGNASGDTIMPLDLINNTQSTIQTVDGNVLIDATGEISLARIDADSDNNSTVGDVSLFARSGDISDVNDDLAASDLNITANQLDMRSSGTIATDANRLETEIDGGKIAAIAGTSGSGGIFVENTGGLTIDTITSQIGGASISGLTAPDDIKVLAASPLTVASGAPVASTSGGDIILASKGTAASDDLTINDSVSSSGGNGNILLAAGDDVEIDNGISVTAAGSGSVTVLAGEDLTDSETVFNQDGNTGDSADIDMSNNSSFNSDSGDILADATGSVDLALVNTSADVTIRARNGGIRDNNGSSNNVEASGLLLEATNGIGRNSNRLETSVDNLEANNNGPSRGIHIHNTGSLTIGGVTPVDGSELYDATNIYGVYNAGSGGVKISTASPLTVDEQIANSNGGVTLLAATGNANADDLTINANITNSGGNGGILLVAADDIIQAADTIISASGNANVELRSGETLTVSEVKDGQGSITFNRDGRNNGDIRQADGAAVRSEDGHILLDAKDDIDIAEVNANSNNDASIGDVTIVARNNHGSNLNIEDVNGADLNITANELDITSSTGIATDADRLETKVNSLAAITSSGGIFIENTGALLITDITTEFADTGLGTVSGVSATSGDIKVFASSPLTIASDVVNAGSDDIQLAAKGSTAADIFTLNDGINISSAGGDIIVAAGNSSNLGDGSSISTTGTGSVSVLAGEDFTDELINQDGLGTGDITMGTTGSATGSISTEDGYIYLDAGRNAEIASLTTNTTGSSVVINARSGAVSDANDTSSALGATNNITTSTLEISAATGVGTAANRLETTISGAAGVKNTGDGLLAVSNESNGIFVHNTGGLQIGTSPNVSDSTGHIAGGTVTPGLSGISNGGASASDVQVTASTRLTVTEDVSNSSGGNITLASQRTTPILGGTLPAEDAFNIDGATISTTGGNGNITLVSAGEFVMENSASVSASGTGEVIVRSGENTTDSLTVFTAETATPDGVDGSGITMDESSSILSQDGDITVDSRAGIDVSVINSDSNSDTTAGNVRMLARNGSIADSNDATIPDTLNITADTLNIEARGGSIGIPNPIEINVNTLTPTTTAGPTGTPGGGSSFTSTVGGPTIIKDAVVNGPFSYNGQGSVILENNFANGSSVIDVNGDILSGGDPSDDFAAQGLTLIANNGGIGTPEQILNLNIFGGQLFIHADSINNGLSVNVHGNISRNDVQFLNIPPGLVLYNNHVLGGQNAQSLSSALSIQSLPSNELFWSLGQFGQSTETIIPELNIIGSEGFQDLIQVEIIEPPDIILGIDVISSETEI